MNFEGRKKPKTLEVQTGVGIPVKLTIYHYMVLDKFLANDRVIPFAASEGTCIHNRFVSQEVSLFTFIFSKAK